MSKYGKSISMTHEEEGTYHRREIEHVPVKPEKTYTTTKTYHQVVPKRSDHEVVRHRSNKSSDDEDNYEEWTVSKRKVNHKTRQVETRVARQLLIEDGKVIADSGPQVITRIKEDNKEEECEKEKEPKNKSKFEALENAPECDSSGRVLGEKRQITRVSREVREENMQYHDERFKELTGKDVHRRAIKAPHELITITDKDHQSHDRAPRGKMVHYSNKGKKYRDTDEVLEVAKLAIDGSVTKEVKRTKHHEEFSEDEKPDETGEAEALRETGPTVSRSSRRHVDYVNDFDDTSASSDDDGARDHRREHKTTSSAVHSSRPSSSKHKSSRSRQRADSEDPAFPRYEIDPLLNSLREEDFKSSPNIGYESPLSQRRSKGHQIEHLVGRKDRSSSTSGNDDYDYDHDRSHSRQRVSHHSASTSNKYRQGSPVAHRSGSTATPVEIPPEYRINKAGQQSSRRAGSKSSLQERTYSPGRSPVRHHTTSKSSKSLHRSSSQKEDASVQAHLTDEEEERKSLKSTSSSEIAHEKQTRHLQRQSTANSSRHYYYGDGKSRSRHEPTNKSTSNRRRDSVSSASSSSSSLSDIKERNRKHGTKSRDSGFKSPSYSNDRLSTPASAGADGDRQIYSVSNNRSKGHRKDVVSPTPTNTSLGQRSVKTTTTSLTAGLADRPLSRQDRSITPERPKRSNRGEQKSASRPTADKYNELHRTDEQVTRTRKELDRSSTATSPTRHKYNDGDDNVSLSSLSHATTIKVPYKRIEIQRSDRIDDDRSDWSDDTIVSDSKHRGSRNKSSTSQLNKAIDDKHSKQEVEETSSVMTLQEDIASLGKRLESINNRSTDPKRYYDHKTIVANIEPIQVAPKKQVINAYNVRVIEHKSPFHTEQQPIKTISDLSDTIARLELLSNLSDSGKGSSTLSAADNNSAKISVNETSTNINDNNNETNFNLSQFIKYKATPVMVEPSIALDGKIYSNDEDENMSVSSSCSLKSSRTYDIKTTSAIIDCKYKETPHLNEDHVGEDQKVQPIELDDEKRPKAWVFDPNDGTSVRITPPVRPKQPEAPKIDSKTEELAESRGGRSYYLELIEPKQSVPKRSCSIDPIYQRWNSHCALNINSTSNTPNIATIQQIRKTERPILQSRVDNRSRLDLSTKNNCVKAKKTIAATSNSNIDQQCQKQLPPGRVPMGNKSKSISCLVGSTRSSKYSIYGGLRKPNESGKPVPRLSYSRAIGPKSHRHVEAQPKPSRYLKMK